MARRVGGQRAQENQKNHECGGGERVKRSIAGRGKWTGEAGLVEESVIGDGIVDLGRKNVDFFSTATDSMTG